MANKTQHVEQHYVAGSDFKLLAGNIVLEYARGDEILLSRDSENGAFVRYFKGNDIFEININRLPDDLYRLFDHVVSVGDELDEEISFASVPMRELVSNRSLGSYDIVSLATEANFEFNPDSEHATLNNVPVRRRSKRQNYTEKKDALLATSPVDRTEGAFRRNLHSIEARRVGATDTTGYVVDRESLGMLAHGLDISSVRESLEEHTEDLEIKQVSVNRLVIDTSGKEITEEQLIESLAQAGIDLRMINLRNGRYSVELPPVSELGDIVEGEDTLDENTTTIEVATCCGDDSVAEGEESEEDDARIDGDMDALKVLDVEGGEKATTEGEENLEESVEDSDEPVEEETEEDEGGFSNRRSTRDHLTVNEIWKKLEEANSTKLKSVKTVTPRAEGCLPRRCLEDRCRMS